MVLYSLKLKVFDFLFRDFTIVNNRTIIALLLKSLDLFSETLEYLSRISLASLPLDFSFIYYEKGRKCYVRE